MNPIRNTIRLHANPSIGGFALTLGMAAGIKFFLKVMARKLFKSYAKSKVRNEAKKGAVKSVLLNPSVVPVPMRMKAVEDGLSDKDIESILESFEGLGEVIQKSFIKESADKMVDEGVISRSQSDDFKSGKGVEIFDSGVGRSKKPDSELSKTSGPSVKTDPETKPPRGFTKIPGRKGYRRDKQGGGYEYWYPR